MSEFSGEHGRAPCGIDDPTRVDGAIAAMESGAEENGLYCVQTQFTSFHVER